MVLGLREWDVDVWRGGVSYLLKIGRHVTMLFAGQGNTSPVNPECGEMIT